jgi:uncharacterized membrane protein YphA (DoxX/SURF4 family)
MLTGFLLGLALSRTLKQIASARLAQWYYSAIVVLLAIGYTATIATLLLANRNVLTILGMATSITSTLLFGAVWGIPVLRERPRELLSQSLLFDAIRMTVAFTFALAGIGKAFNMMFMTTFFTQSGYSVTFLKFIMIGEVLGAVALLLPWSFLPMLAAFTTDMFGAIVTHIQNHDPVNDSAGAIAMLIRLAAIAALWTLHADATRARFRWRRSLATITAAGAACATIAIVGSVALRHSTH